MPMILDEEQEILQRTAREFVSDHMPVKHLRALRDARDATGFSAEVWKRMAEMGWTGIVLPEEHGGSGLGYAELGVVLEECGRTLAPEPLLASLVLGAETVLQGGSAAQQAALLPPTCNGDGMLALAFQEGGRFHPYRVETRAEGSGDGFLLNGEKQFVPNGHMADRLIVVARTAGAATDRTGLTLFLVDPGARGVTVTRQHMVDNRNAALVGLDAVTVGAQDVIGKVSAGADVLDAVFDRATIAICAEMLGSATEAFERTIAYLKTREQFGTKIGTFQALQHRAAKMFCELELSRSLVLDALRAIDEAREELPSLASAVKAKLSETVALVSQEALQMHGGIGMTDEEEIGFFLKRARADELFLGDARHHRDRFAALQGF